jgi:hypothetical protein
VIGSSCSDVRDERRAPAPPLLLYVTFVVPVTISTLAQQTVL